MRRQILSQPAPLKCNCELESKSSAIHADTAKSTSSALDDTRWEGKLKFRAGATTTTESEKNGGCELEP